MAMLLVHCAITWFDYLK